MKTLSRFLKLIWILSFYSFCIGEDTATAFIKYYRSDRDFVADAPMLATARSELAHLEVTFNEQKHPVIKRWLDSDHKLIKEEMFVYDEAHVLKKRLFLNKDRQSDKIIHYGESEPWSYEFIKFTRKEQTSVSYSGQQTEFILNGKDVISEIRFRTVNDHEYGTITLAYDHLGFLQEEVWRTLPGGEVVRTFIYDFDIINNVKQIWEYTAGDYKVSHVALSMAPEDQLYITPPPRTGNILDEADVILKELRSKRSISAYPAIIPYTEWDRLTMLNNEELDIVIINFDEHNLRFSLPDESEVLSMSLDKISNVKNKFGKIVYP